MTAQKKYKDYESALERLEIITDDLENGEKSLEESITLYTEGLEIAKFCNGKLEEAEKKVKIITEENSQLIETNFDSEDES